MAKAKDDIKKINLSQKEYVFAYDETTGDQDFSGRAGICCDPIGMVRATGYVINTCYRTIEEKNGDRAAKLFKKKIREMVMVDDFWNAEGMYCDMIEDSAEKLN